MKSLYQWAKTQVDTPHASLVFVLLVFIESFFFVPVSSLLIFYCLAKKDQAFWYATLASATSIVGGAMGYGIGALIGSTWGQQAIPLSMAHSSRDWFIMPYSAYGGMALIITSLLPLPYKFLTLTAGFFKFPLLWFLLCTCTARAIKFFSIAAAIDYFGDSINHAIDRHFPLLVGLGIFAVIASLFIFTH